MWRKSSSLWDNTFVRSRKWSCKMNQILQLSVLYQFKDILINLQCFNLFLSSHRFLFFFAKVGNFIDLSPKKLSQGLWK